MNPANRFDGRERFLIEKFGFIDIYALENDEDELSKNYVKVKELEIKTMNYFISILQRQPVTSYLEEINRTYQNLITIKKYKQACEDVMHFCYPQK